MMSPWSWLRFLLFRSGSKSPRDNDTALQASAGDCTSLDTFTDSLPTSAARTHVKPSPTTMKLQLLSLGRDHVIRLRWEDKQNIRCEAAEEDALEKLLGPSGFRRKVLLCLEGCQAMSTSGLSWLIQSHKRFLQEGGRLVLHTVPPLLREMMDFVRLTPLLEIAADEVAAAARVLDTPAAPGINDYPEDKRATAPETRTHREPVTVTVNGLALVSPGALCR